VLDEADAIHLRFVDLCPEIDGLDLFTPFYGAYLYSVKVDDAPLGPGALVK
jgi:hypothetical protein